MGKVIHIKWDENVSVGIPLFDKQHKKLYDIMNDFFNLLQNGSGIKKVLETMNELKEYTDIHFSSEEKIMQEYGYEEYELHKLQHESFMSELIQLQNNIVENNIIPTIESMRYIFIWLEKHIKDSDIRYSEFMIEKGIW
jgi:hemerythrin